MIRKILPLFFILVIFFFSRIPLASAMCPLCVVGAAAGLSITRYYGIDDSVVGIWLGALAVSTALWINVIVKNKINKTKRKPVPFQDILIIAVVFVATIAPFYFAGFFKGVPSMVDTLFGVNRLVFGVIVGSTITFAGAPISNFIKRKRSSVLPYQTIILTVVLLTAFSILFWYITKNYYIV